MKSHHCWFCWSLLFLVKQHETGKSNGRLTAATRKLLTGYYRWSLKNKHIHMQIRDYMWQLGHTLFKNCRKQRLWDLTYVRHPLYDCLPNWSYVLQTFCFQLMTFHVRSQNCEKRLLASSCLSACPHGTTRWFPLDEFSWNLLFEHLSKICRENKIWCLFWPCITDINNINNQLDATITVY